MSAIGEGHTSSTVTSTHSSQTSQKLPNTHVQIDVDKLLNIDFSHLRVAITHLLSLVETCTSRTSSVEQQLHVMAARNEALEAQLGAQNQAMRSVQEKLNDHTNEIKALKQMETVQNEKIELLEKSLHDADHHNSQLAHVLERLTKAEESNQALKDEQTKLQQSIDALQLKDADLEQQLLSLQGELESLRSQASVSTPAVSTPVVAVATARASLTKPITVTPPSLPSTPQHANTQNYDAFNLRLKQLSNSLDHLSGRVSVLESRQGSGTVSSWSAGSQNTNEAALEPLFQQQAQTAKQLHASVQDIHELQRQVVAMQNDIKLKESIDNCALKADLVCVDELKNELENHKERFRTFEFEQEQQNHSIANCIDLQKLIGGKVDELINAQACSVCRNERPVYKCLTCKMQLCEACDTARHEGSDNEDRKHHVRTPLTGPTPIDVSHAAPGHTSSPSFQFNPHSGAADSALRQWCEDQIALLQKKERATRADIHDLYEKDKAMKSSVQELSKSQKEDHNLIEELSNAIKKLEIEFSIKINNVQSTSKNYTDHRCDDFLNKLRDLEKALEKGLKAELRRFERDVMAFMEDSRHEGAEAAVGKIHFRCLSCDQYTSSLQGPASLLYTRAVTASPSNTSSTTMQIDRGRELYLTGRDGAVYRGRDSSVVTLTPGDPNKNANFNVAYHENMPTTNPTRASIREEHTVSVSNGSTSATPTRATPHAPHILHPTPPHASARPSTAPFDEALAHSTLPPVPTRPSTQHRSARPIREGDATPLREAVHSARSVKSARSAQAEGGYRTAREQV